MASNDPILGQYGGWVLSNVSEMFTKTELYKQINNYFAKLSHTHTTSNITDISTNYAPKNHTHNATDFTSLDFTLKQTFTIATGVTVRVYANALMVYIKFQGTATLTANTNTSVSNAINSEYRPYAPTNDDYYEYGLIAHSNANIFGAVNQNGTVYIINKTSNTSSAVYGSIMYPRKTVVDVVRSISFTSTKSIIQTGDSVTFNATVKDTDNQNLANKIIMFFADMNHYGGGSSTPSTPIPSSITLASDKSILSQYNNESATLTATVLDANSSPVNNVSVEFFKGSTSLGTATTNSSGVATKSYSSTGVGDVSFTATTGSLTSSAVTIEDCIYYAPSETSVTRSGTSIWGYWDTGRFSNLPSTYTVEFDMKTSTAPVSNGEQRLYWCPTSQWTGTSTQPQNALIIGYAYKNGTKIEYGKRLNGTTSTTVNISSSVNNWDNVKIAKVNTSGRCDFYINGTYRDYYTFTNMESYSEFAITYFIWSNTTFSVKNIKIKRTS